MEYETADMVAKSVVLGLAGVSAALTYTGVRAYVRNRRANKHLKEVLRRNAPVENFLYEVSRTDSPPQN